MYHVPKVEHLLTILAKKGVVVEEKTFLMRMNLCAHSSRMYVGTLITSEDRNAADLVVGAMLDVLGMSAYSAKFLECAVKWLETHRVDSKLTGSRIFSVSRKLLTIDKHRIWEKRFCTLFWRHAASILKSDVMDCFCTVADHYRTSNVTGPLEASCTRVNSKRSYCRTVPVRTGPVMLSTIRKYIFRKLKLGKIRRQVFRVLNFS